MVNMGYLYYKLAQNNAAPFTHQASDSIFDQEELYFQSS
jgi:hypothetical protein